MQERSQGTEDGTAFFSLKPATHEFVSVWEKLGGNVLKRTSPLKKAGFALSPQPTAPQTKEFHGGKHKNLFI